ncbi:MAG: hypothetical protein XXXJIFNMEKO3_00101 [Candidatus Erwinia impunctatus]|nr:hypothetical protein XXXJIFNMEKO_00101 [Culicoides impunctatus]
MKGYKPRYEELQKCYQNWLTNFTKLTVRQGMCHQNIYHYHSLTVGCLNFHGKKAVIAIVPHWLHRLIYGKAAAASLSIDDDLSVSLLTQEHLLAHHPTLEGVLLSECVRLKQRSRQISSPAFFSSLEGLSSV